MTRHTLTMLERIGDRVAQQGPAVNYVFAEGDPAEEMLCAAERRLGYLIVLGSKGLMGLEHYPLGGVWRKVARHASCSVPVVRRRGR